VAGDEPPALPGGRLHRLHRRRPEGHPRPGAHETEFTSRLLLALPLLRNPFHSIIPSRLSIQVASHFWLKSLSSAWNGPCLSSDLTLSLSALRGGLELDESGIRAHSHGNYKSFSQKSDHMRPEWPHCFIRSHENDNTQP